MGAVSSHRHIQRHHVGSLKMATVESIYTREIGKHCNRDWLGFFIVVAPQLAVNHSPAHHSLEGIIDLTRGPLFSKYGHPSFLKLPKQF